MQLYFTDTLEGKKYFSNVTDVVVMGNGKFELRMDDNGVPYVVQVPNGDDDPAFKDRPYYFFGLIPPTKIRVYRNIADADNGEDGIVYYARNVHPAMVDSLKDILVELLYKFKDFGTPIAGYRTSSDFVSWFQRTQKYKEMSIGEFCNHQDDLEMIESERQKCHDMQINPVVLMKGTPVAWGNNVRLAKFYEKYGEAFTSERITQIHEVFVLMNLLGLFFESEEEGAALNRLVKDFTFRMKANRLVQDIQFNVEGVLVSIALIFSNRTVTLHGPISPMEGIYKYLRELIGGE